MSKQQHLSYLIKLLDDESEITQAALSEQFSQFTGDISDDIAAMGIDIAAADLKKLSSFLKPARRKTLEENWSIPDHLDDDWESFEHLLRLLSDYMHNGTSLRASLPDALDLLSEEFLENTPKVTENRLRRYLFRHGRFQGEKVDYYALENSDICHCLESGKGNPITLCIIFQMIARRIDLDVSASNYPGHFLSRIYLEGHPQLVDCFNQGKVISINELLVNNTNLSAEAKYAINTPAPARVILHRVLRNMEHSLTLSNQPHDILLMQKLQGSLVR